jgi:CHAD domain-containing protein
MTVETALQAIGRECLADLTRHEREALAGESEAFHQMRVALRRLRSVLSAMKPMLPSAQYREVQARLKWLAKSLEPTRDWDAFSSDLLAPVQQVQPEGVDLAPLAAAAKLRRRASYETAKDALRSPRYRQSLQSLAQWFDARGWRCQQASEHSAPLFAPIAEMAPSLIERHWRQMRKRSKHFTRLSPAERHRLRLALKKLRYVVEFLGGLFEADDVKALMKRLKPLQAELGHLNDVRTAQRLLKEIIPLVARDKGEASEEAGLVLGWYIRGAADEEAKLRKHVRRLRNADPFWRPLHRALPVEGSNEAPPAPAL